MKLTLTLVLLLSLSACTNVSCRDVNCDGYVDIEFEEVKD